MYKGDRRELVDDVPDLKLRLAELGRLLRDANRVADAILNDDLPLATLAAFNITVTDICLGTKLAEQLPFALMGNILRCRGLDHQRTPELT